MYKKVLYCGSTLVDHSLPPKDTLFKTPNSGVVYTHHRRSQYEANRGTRLGKILSNTVDFYFFFIRLIILEDFIRLISYNGPCVRLGCSFFLATALPILFKIASRPSKLYPVQRHIAV